MKSLDFRLVGAALWIGVMLAIVYGWGSNIYKLAISDFESPYKSEVIRVIGVPFAPIGVIAGYMDIGDEGE